MPAERHDPATVELVASVLHQEGCEDPCPGNCAKDAVAVLDALSAAGKLADAAHDARVRAQAGEDIAWMFGAKCECTTPDPPCHAELLAGMVRAYVREVTGASGEAVDGG